VLLGGSIVFIIAITFYQQRKTERALEALRDLASPRALVIRDGEHVRIPGREVLRGDLVVLAEGDRVPADGVLRSANDLLLDESLLTAESMPVSKIATDATPEPVPPGGDDSPVV
jgi:Ca2+-transporting ATPase